MCECVCVRRVGLKLSLNNQDFRERFFDSYETEQMATSPVCFLAINLFAEILH